MPEFIRSELALPAIMDNDANVGALGEANFGAGFGFDPLFYMTLSTGIGGGIISAGRLRVLILTRERLVTLRFTPEVRLSLRG
ncbi:MAG: ROK family protein [Bryobacteraceae bacterium]